MARGTKRRAARPHSAGMQALLQCSSKSELLGSGHDPFSLLVNDMYIPENVMDLFWACCSVPDLLALIPASRAGARDAERKLLTLARLVELWGGCPSVQAVLYESSSCQRASASHYSAGADPSSFSGLRVAPALSVPKGPLCAAGALGEHASRILAEGVQWVLRARLHLPKKHLLLRFFRPGLKADFCVCDIRKTASHPDLEHYSFRVHPLGCLQDCHLHVSVRTPRGRLGAQPQGWHPDRAGRLLGSAPWRVADALELRAGSLFVMGDRVKIRRPLPGIRFCHSDPTSQGTVVGRTLRGLYHVKFDGDSPIQWHGSEHQLMHAAEPFTDPLFKAIEERDAQALGCALDSHAQGDLTEVLMYAVETAFVDGLEQFPLQALVELRDTLEERHEALRYAIEQYQGGARRSTQQVAGRAPPP